ncbi:MAG: sulfotransferase [Myxococcota bacterium]
MGEPIRFAFLVYLGRSGSTLLARQLDSISRDLLVTPELNFIVTAALAGDAAIRALSPAELVRFVRRDLQIANLDLPIAELDACVRACAGQGVRALAECLVRAHADRRGRSPSVVVVKKSVAHLGADPLLEVFPEAVFVHIRRDGRAVVNSLIHTESVYDPGHLLGRGDPVHAAKLWVRQLRSIEDVGRRHPGRVLEVEYESLLRSPGTVLESLRADLAARIGVELRDARSESGFVVPERERTLHRLVSQAPVEERADRWRDELGRANGIAVEAIQRDWLRRCGYTEHFLAGKSAAAIARVRAQLYARHLGLTSRHLLWRGATLLRLLFSDPGLAVARTREAIFQRYGAPR